MHRDSDMTNCERREESSDAQAAQSEPETIDTRLLYSGEQFREATEPQYLRARYFMPVSSKWSQLDPFFKAPSATDSESPPRAE